MLRLNQAYLINYSFNPNYVTQNILLIIDTLSIHFVLYLTYLILSLG